MESQNTTLNPKEELQKLLQEAEEKKETDIEQAIDLLFKAEQLLPQLSSDENKGSERNATQHNHNKEVLYFSKRGNILYELKDYEGAAVCYKAIKDRLPNNPQVYKAYGDCVRKLSQYNNAIQQYEDGLRIDKKLDSPAPNVTAGLLNSKGLAYLGLKKYQEALKDFEAAIQVRRKNPLYHCNSGHAAFALGDIEKAFGYFKKASELIDSTRKGNLTTHNISYIQKKTEQFIQELKEFDALSLPVKDSIMDTRGQQYREKGIEALSEPNNEQEGAEKAISRVIDQGPQLIKTKENLKRIKEDPMLNQFYDGFMFTLQQSYLTAVVLNSGQLAKETGHDKFDLITKAISLVPLVGSQISDYITSAKDFAKSAKATKAAANVCKFETTQADFEAIAQDALCQVIIDKESQLKSLKEEHLNDVILPSWAKRFQSIADKIGELGTKIKVSLYGDRNETPLQKFGYQTASTLISEHIASGEIYGGIPAVKIPSSEKTAKLINIMSKVIDQSFDSS